MESKARRSRFAKLSDSASSNSRDGEIDWSRDKADDDPRNELKRGGRRTRDDRSDADRNARVHERRPFLNGPMKMGLAALAIGIGLTLATYGAADGNNGTYFVFRGAMVLGVIQIIRGLLMR